MREKLESKGWVMYHQCDAPCGHQQYYSSAEKPGYEIRVKTMSKTFSIFLNNQMISGPHWNFDLEAKLLKNGL